MSASTKDRTKELHTGIHKVCIMVKSSKINTGSLIILQKKSLLAEEHLFQTCDNLRLHQMSHPPSQNRR